MHHGSLVRERGIVSAPVVGSTAARTAKAFVDPVQKDVDELLVFEQSVNWL